MIDSYKNRHVRKKTAHSSDIPQSEMNKLSGMSSSLCEWLNNKNADSAVLLDALDTGNAPWVESKAYSSGFHGCDQTLTAISQIENKEVKQQATNILQLRLVEAIDYFADHLPDHHISNNMLCELSGLLNRIKKDQDIDQERKGKIFDALCHLLDALDKKWPNIKMIRDDEDSVKWQMSSLISALQYAQREPAVINAIERVLGKERSNFLNNEPPLFGDGIPDSRTKCNTCGKSVLLWKNNMFTFPALRGMRYSAF